LNKLSGLESSIALVTGATGFVGSHLVDQLNRKGFQVHAVIRQSSDTTQLQRLPNKSIIHEHDGTANKLLDIMRRVQPRFIFHVASEVIIEHQLNDLDALIQSNIKFGTQLLEAFSIIGGDCFINTGSYWQHSDSSDYNPVNLYAATKQAFEDILCFYTECRSIRAVTLKLFDVYGPCDPRKKLFTLLDEAFRSGKTLDMTKGEQKLDFVFIEDVVRAYCRAAELLSSNDPQLIERSYTVSSNHPMSLRDIVETYQRVTGRTLSIHWGKLPYRPRQVMMPWSGKNLPGWKAETNLESGIRKMLSQSPICVASEGT